MKTGTRIAVQIKTTQPKFTVKEISKENIKDYWGYDVKERADFFIIMERKNNPNIKKWKNFYND